MAAFPAPKGADLMYGRTMSRQARQAGAKRSLSKAEIAKRIAEAGQRAAAEAEARRKAEHPVAMPKEEGGPKGPEPTRYGDWERKGIVSDF
jgi:hypothetical protein